MLSLQERYTEFYSSLGTHSLDRITKQQDFYDLGAMLYEQLPVLAPVTRFLRRSLVA
jgi:hypothetical protein